MQFLNTGILLAILGGLGTAAPYFIKAVKSVLSVKNSFLTIQEHQKETYMMCLKLVIMSEEMPMTERIEAGDKYIKIGGNGAVKQKYKSLLDEYRKEITQ